MAQHSGFFNALMVNGDYDRKYNADDYSSNMGAIISTGVRRSGDNDLNVTASGLTITVAAGRAWINGRWFYNDTALELATVAPPVGTLSRADGVYLQANTNINARTMQLVYKTGTPSAAPTAPACTRSDGIYEIQLATIMVAPNAETVTVIDTRANLGVCGWITSPVGYDDYWTNLDASFNAWFEETKDTVASVTLFKQYVWSTTTTSSTSTVIFDIPQYDSTGTDIIQVYTNGLLELQGTDYTLSGSAITFTQAKTAGTEVAVICYKSIDGTGLGSVSDEITTLQNQVAALGGMEEYYYFCNGVNDNVQITMLGQTFLNGSSTDKKRLKLHICGTFGANAPATGSGSSIVPFQWFYFGRTLSTSTNRRIILDFYNCSAVNIQPQSGKYNVLFGGNNITVEGLTLTAGASTYSSLHIIGADGKKCCFRDCDINITGAWDGGTMYFMNDGEVVDSKIVVINYLNSAAVFNLTNNTHLVRVFGGYYYAYTGLSTGYAAGIYTAPNLTAAAAVAVGASFPQTAKASLYQTNAGRINSGYLTALGLITPLPITTTSSATASITGTIPLDKDQ